MTYSDLATLMLKTGSVEVAVSNTSEQDAINSLERYGHYVIVKYDKDNGFCTSALATAGWKYAVPVLPNGTPLRTLNKENHAL